jgi:hypothetical protein
MIRGDVLRPRAEDRARHEGGLTEDERYTVAGGATEGRPDDVAKGCGGATDTVLARPPTGGSGGHLWASDDQMNSRRHVGRANVSFLFAG